jgi:hypothetical protein
MTTKQATEASHDITPGEDYADLDAMVQVDAEPWMPKSGDRLFGVVLGVETADYSEYGEYPIVFIQTPDGTEVAFHAFHTVAKTAILRADPRPGNRIGIMYKGQKEGSGGNGKNDYENYRVVVRPPRDDDTF